MKAYQFIVLALVGLFILVLIGGFIWSMLAFAMSLCFKLFSDCLGYFLGMVATGYMLGTFKQIFDSLEYHFAIQEWYRKKDSGEPLSKYSADVINRK